MRVLVCGGRNYDDAQKVSEVLDGIHREQPITELIQGAARGADSLACSWAMRNGIRIRSFPADWRSNGKSAGPIRNQQMLDEGVPELAVVAPGGNGTADMKRRLKVFGIRMIEV
jgi:hypothetical protein